MEQKKILEHFKRGTLNVEEALYKIEEIGHSPNLMNDDNGHWVLVSDGFQNVPYVEGNEDITSTVFIGKDEWKDSIREAIIHYLEK